MQQKHLTSGIFLSLLYKFKKWLLQWEDFPKHSNQDGTVQTPQITCTSLSNEHNHNTTQQIRSDQTTTQHNTTQHSTAQHSKKQQIRSDQNTTQQIKLDRIRSELHCSYTTQHNTTQQDKTRHNTTQHSTTDQIWSELHCSYTTQHNTTQHNTKKELHITELTFNWYKYWVSLAVK